MNLIRSWTLQSGREGVGDFPKSGVGRQQKPRFSKYRILDLKPYGVRQSERARENGAKERPTGVSRGSLGKQRAQGPGLRD